MNISKEELLWMYEHMRLIREVEEQIRGDFAGGKIPGFVHVSVGQEAVPVGMLAQLTDRDFITATHRGHGHCIAKGQEIKAMMAELYGRATGICKGKGGSMHLADFEKGIIGANGILGAGQPLACGAGLTAKIKGTDQVVVSFFGDGASNEGAVSESLNLAGIWKLPVIFVCENNRYAQATSPDYSVAGQDIAARARSYGMPSVVVNGMDIFAVYEAASEAIDRARRGEGPSFIEAQTYRYYGHFEGDPMTYRDEEEVNYYRAQDPLEGFRKTVTGQGLISAAELDEIDRKVLITLGEAVTFAEESPYPDLAETLDDVYVDIPASHLWPFQTVRPQ